jgi:uncharacterized protein YprB with RNaseH-like and TPR domain
LLARHGQYTFAELLTCELAPLARAAKLREVPGVAALRFYDTETSGLGTGAGTVPFLHAVARVVGDELRLTQYFLADYADEPAMLAAICDEEFAAPDTVVVTFNGRTFDWPLFQNRLLMYRLGAELGWPMEETQHIDLLLPSRRLWRAVFGSVSLHSLEEQLLGLQRQDDVPGKEAPLRYFTFVNEGSAAQIGPVLEHNAMDVCSLVTLAAQVADVLAGRRPAVHAAEHLALGRWYDEWQAFDRATQSYRAAAAAPDADWRVHWLHSLRLKRRGMWAQACAEWQRMLDRYPDSALPAVELAKVAEHRDRDLTAAAEFTRIAIARRTRQLGSGAAQPLHPAGEGTDGILAALAHRLARIERKARQHTPV